MNWNDIRYLEGVVRLGTVAAVAREVGVSPSTVYRRVAALEEHLGAPCLVRGAGAITLTPTGQALVDAARETRAGIAQAHAIARAGQDGDAGRVSLTTVADFLPCIVEPLATLRADHPGLEIEVHLADSGPSVRRREVDVAIAVIAHPPEGLVGRRLAPIRYGVFGLPAAIAADPRRWIVSGPPRAHTPNAIWERTHAGRVAMVTGSRLAGLAFLQAGLGVGVLPRRLARLHPELVEVEAFAARLEPQTRDAWVLHHPDAGQTTRVRLLVDALYAALAPGG